MAEPTTDRKPRRYHAPRRAEQAAATRRAIIEAAGHLFAEHGYAATTMAAIAAEARVAVKSVYLLAEKPQLLLLALDQAIAGDDEPVAIIDRPDTQAVLHAEDPPELARRAAALGAATLLRLYPLYRAFEQATAAEPTLEQAWRDYQQRRRRDIEQVVDAIVRVGALRPALTRDRAVDTIWALITWHPVALLVEERGWSREDLTDWLQELFAGLLAPLPT